MPKQARSHVSDGIVFENGDVLTESGESLAVLKDAGINQSDSNVSFVRQGADDEIMPETLAEFYSSLALNDNQNSSISRILLQMICWNNSVFTYDPFSDQPLSTDLDAYTKRLRDYETHLTEYPVKDHVFHLVEFINNEIRYLLNEIRQNIYRSHEPMPLYMVRETDGKSLQILARRPGRTIKEKLSGNPVMVAVKRRFTFNTLENRLLKIFLKKLAHLLLLRKKAFSEASLPYNDLATDLITKISYWKTSEAADDIGAWKNNPPNNVLLQDRRYRKIWLGWQRLRSFDDAIKQDFQLLPYYVTDYLFWEIASFLNGFENCRLFQKPLSRSNKKSPDDFYDKYRYTIFIEYKDVYYKLRGEKQNNSIYIYIDMNLCGEVVSERDVLHSQINEEMFSVEMEKVDLKNFAHEFICQVIASQGVSADRFVPRAKDSQIPRIMPFLAADLTSAYPRYFNDVSEHVCSFRPMVQFWTDSEKNERRISCERSKGIFLSHQDFDINTYTFRTIFDTEDIKNENSRYKFNEAARELGDLMYRYLPAHRLVYAIPDMLDDFDLEPIRVGLGGAYGVANSVPASIASVLSVHINNAKLCADKDLIIVMDFCHGGVSLTPVLCNFDAKLQKQIPETRGIQFTRYPTICIRAETSFSDGEVVSDNSDIAGELMKLFDDDGLSRNINNTSFMTFDGQSHYEHLNTHGKVCRREIRTIRENSLERYIKECRFMKYNSVKLLPLSAQLNLDAVKGKYSVIPGFGITSEGVYRSAIYEDKLPDDLVLWFDYLPTLSMEAMVQGERKLWYLVRDRKVRPRLNEPVSLPVKESFILPAGKKFFHFPLVKGNANEKTQYEAYIESEQLPLKTELQCKLHLTYTYGAETPFNLVFMPINNNDIEPLQVQWKFKDDIPVDLSSFPIPSFPLRKSLDLLMHFKSKKVEGRESNLIIEFKELLEILLSSKKCKMHEFVGRVERRKRNNDFDFYIVKTDYGDVEYFIHNSNLKKEEFLLRSDGPVYLRTYVQNGKHKLKFFNAKSIRGKVIFLTANLFNLGWKINDFQPDVVQCFERFVLFVQKELNDNDSIDYSMMQLYMMIIAFATDVIPDNIIEYIYSKIPFNNTSRVISRIYGKMLHKCDEHWQIDLFDKCLKYLDRYYQNLLDDLKNDRAVKINVLIESVLGIFAKAIWHDEKFVLLLSPEYIKKILFYIKLVFEKNYNELKEIVVSKNPKYEKSKSLRIGDINVRLDKCTAYLELVLGLVRSRLSDDNVKILMIPDADFNKQFVSLLNAFSKFIKQHNNLQLKCFLEINLDKKKFNEKVPPIISAVKHYLTAEDDSDAIRIVGLATEEESSDAEADGIAF